MASGPTKILNQVELAKARLISMFKISTTGQGSKIQSVVASFAEQIQDLENMFFELFEQRWLDTATGKQLDNLGKILDEARNGQNDTDYRATLQAKVRLNSTNGTVEDIIQTLIDIGAATVDLTQFFPAAFLADIGEIDVNEDFVRNKIDLSKGGGIKGGVLYGPAVDAKRFDTAARGFDDGKFGNVI